MAPTRSREARRQQLKQWRHTRTIKISFLLAVIGLEGLGSDEVGLEELQRKSSEFCGGAPSRRSERQAAVSGRVHIYANSQSQSGAKAGSLFIKPFFYHSCWQSGSVDGRANPFLPPALSMAARSAEVPDMSVP